MRREQPRPGMRSRPSAAPVCVVLLAVLMAGCVGAMGVSEVARNYWREDMGRITPATLDAGVRMIIQKHSFRLDRREQSVQELYYESNWVEREVVAEEEVRGVSNARNRFVLRGRALEPELGGGAVYRITWELQNEVTSRDRVDRGWHPGPLPESVREDFQQVYADLFMEVRTGVKR